MFSVVLPTMWRGAELSTMLPLILAETFVGEVIIINNDSAKTPKINHKKIKFIDPGKNIFVNPAWNLGVAESKYDKICLLSDDVLFHPSLFTKIHKDVSNKVGVFGPHVDNFKTQRPLENKPLHYANCECPYPVHYVFGCLMFLHRENWINIPDEFKIYYGDTFLTSYNYCVRQKMNHYTMNQDMKTTWGTTSNKFSSMALQEHLARAEVFARYIPQRVWKPIDKDRLLQAIANDSSVMDNLFGTPP